LSSLSSISGTKKKGKNTNENFLLHMVANGSAPLLHGHMGQVFELPWHYVTKVKLFL